MPDQNLNFPRRAILGGALKLGGTLFAVALLENNYN